MNFKSTLQRFTRPKAIITPCLALTFFFLLISPLFQNLSVVSTPLFYVSSFLTPLLIVALWMASAPWLWRAWIRTNEQVVNARAKDKPFLKFLGVNLLVFLWLIFPWIGLAAGIAFAVSMSHVAGDTALQYWMMATCFVFIPALSIFLAIALSKRITLLWLSHLKNESKKLTLKKAKLWTGSLGVSLVVFGWLVAHFPVYNVYEKAQAGVLAFVAPESTPAPHENQACALGSPCAGGSPFTQHEKDLHEQVCKSTESHAEYQACMREFVR